MVQRSTCVSCPRYDHYHKGCTQTTCTRVVDYRAQKQAEKEYRRNSTYFADYNGYMAYYRMIQLYQ